MTMPAFFTEEADYARFAPQGLASVDEAVALITEAIAYCRSRQIRRLLIDLTQLTGGDPPTLGERYWIVHRWAREAGGRVVIAMMVRAEHADPDDFGVTVAANAGLESRVFLSEPEALDWLRRRPL